MSEVQEVILQPVKEKVREEKQKKKMPKILKWSIGVVLAFVTFFAGGMIGYGVIGDGKPLDALKPSTWIHIYDLIYKDIE